MKRNNQNSSMASRGLLLIGGAAVGAAAGFLYAPQTGGRTRALIRDRFTHWSKRASKRMSRQSRHLQNAAKGLGHQVSNRLGRNGKSPSDQPSPRPEAATSPA